MDINIWMGLYVATHMAVLVLGVYVLTLWLIAWTLRKGDINGHTIETALNWIGFPALLLAWIFQYISVALRWPWTSVNRWRLRDTFGTTVEDTNANIWQAKVEGHLRQLAKSMDESFRKQEQARELEYSFPSAAKDADKEVREAKKNFWQAHELARRNGFNIRPSYKDYLPAPTLERA